MNDILIRTATTGDISAIQVVGLLTWPATYLPFTDPEYVITNINSWWTAEAVRTTVVEETTFVATAESEVVGTLTLGEFEDEPVIWKIYVLPKMQSRGVGAALMNEALNAVGSDQDVRIEFIKGNDHAQSFYARMGFRFDFEEETEDGPTTVWLRRSAISPGSP